MVALNVRRQKGFVQDGGIFTSLNISESIGTIIRNAVFTGPPAQSINVQTGRVWNSPGTRIENCRFLGQPAVRNRQAPFGVLPSATACDKSRNVIGLPTGEGLNITGSDDCIVDGGEIFGFHQGLTFGGNDRLTILGLKVHGCRTAPISGAPGDDCSLIDVEAGDSHPWRLGETKYDGDHGDYAHLFIGKTARRLTIRRLRLLQGGGFPLMGLFLQVTTRAVPGAEFAGLDIEDVLVSTSCGQGVIVGPASGRIARVVLDWTNTAVGAKPAGGWRERPRLDLKKGCHDLDVSGVTATARAPAVAKVVIGRAVGLPASVVVRP